MFREHFVRATIACVLACGLPVGASAESKSVHLMIDGRLLSHTSALTQGGVIYVELGGIVRAFSGLVVFEHDTSTVSIGNRVAVFTVGSARANLDGTMLGTGGKAFELDGDRYVPLAFFVKRLAGAAVHVSSDGKTADVTSRPHGAGIATPSPQANAT